MIFITLQASIKLWPIFILNGSYPQTNPLSPSCREFPHSFENVSTCCSIQNSLSCQKMGKMGGGGGGVRAIVYQSVTSQLLTWKLVLNNFQTAQGSMMTIFAYSKSAWLQPPTWRLVQGYLIWNHYANAITKDCDIMNLVLYILPVRMSFFLGGGLAFLIFGC